MHISVISERGRLRRWQLWLVEALRARPGLDVALQFSEPCSPPPRGLSTLLSFERLIGLANVESASDTIADSTLPPGPAPDGSSDLILDLSGRTNGRRTGVRTLAAQFDGEPDETMLWNALLDGRAPFLSLLDTGTGAAIAIGLPALEAPHHISASADAVYSRLVEGLMKAVLSLAGGNDPAPSTAACGLPEKVPRAAHATAAAFASNRLRHKISSALDTLVKNRPRWVVGWRRRQGRGAPRSATLRVEDFTLLSDDGNRFYADPFVIHHGGLKHVFVEELPYATQRGVISHFTIDANGQASQPRPVLERPHHLSYPHVFAHGGHIWMLPESPALDSLELYRADPFPDRWVLEARIIDAKLHDATLFEKDGRLWLFAASDFRQSSTWDALSLFQAERLTGPWTAHPANPVLLDSRAARPAGAMFEANGHIWRPVQDCSAGYGSALGIAEVTRLDAEAYAQETMARLAFPKATGILGPHTLNWTHDLEILDLYTRT